MSHTSQYVCISVALVHAIAPSLVFVTATEMSYIGLVYRVSTSALAHTRNPRATTLRRPALASRACDQSLLLAPRGRSCVPVYHYPKRWCPVEAGRGPDKTRPVTTAPEEVEVPSRPGVGAASAGVGNRPPTGKGGGIKYCVRDPERTLDGKVLVSINSG